MGGDPGDAAPARNSPAAPDPARPANRASRPRAIIELLWRTETLQLLCDHDIERGVASKSRPEMWNRAVERLPATTIVAAVIKALHDRDDANRNWGPARRVMLDTPSGTST